MVKLLGQVWLFVTSLAETVTAPQLPEIVPPCAMKPAASVAAAGTAPAHCTLAVGGQVMASTGAGTKVRIRSLLLLAVERAKWPPARELPKLAVLRVNAAGSKPV